MAATARAFVMREPLMQRPRSLQPSSVVSHYHCFMPRYHFDLVDHQTVEDHGGQMLADDITAADVADELARRVHEVRPELRGKGYSILVTDGDGNEVHRAPIGQSTE
jgi:Domain of unknown function (DUF6894)